MTCQTGIALLGDIGKLYLAHPASPGCAARIFKKQFASSRYPHVIRLMILILLLQPSGRICFRGGGHAGWFYRRERG